MKVLNRYWWILALQGFFLLVVGALAVFDTSIFIRELVEYLALIFLVFGGLLGIAAILFRKKARNWSLMLIFGFMEAALGGVILANPDSSTEIYTYIVGGWAFLVGLVQAAFAFSRSASLALNLINALVSVAFGALIIWNPFDTIEALTYLVGFYSMILGLMIIYYSYRLRSWSGEQISRTQGKVQGDKDRADLHSVAD